MDILSVEYNIRFAGYHLPLRLYLAPLMVFGSKLAKYY